ncbi:Rab3 GTPase-activating protein non-catalytic subunit domain-containing protein [Chloropicon primus]|nr:Rab3 GTPase-activating protein non-catalytic subunit domain-containing protein [Chloropicon primus]
MSASVGEEGRGDAVVVEERVLATVKAKDLRWLVGERKKKKKRGGGGGVEEEEEEEEWRIAFAGGGKDDEKLVVALAFGSRLSCVAFERRRGGGAFELTDKYEQNAPTRVTALVWTRLDFGEDGGAWYLALGGRDGTFRLLDETTRVVVHESRADSTAVLSIQAHNLAMGLRRDLQGVTSQGLTLVFEGAVSLVQLEDLIRIHQDHKRRPKRPGKGLRRGSRDGAADFAKFNLATATAGACDAVALGCANLPLQEQLLGSGGDGADGKRRRVRIVVAGADPALSCVHVDTRGADALSLGMSLLSTALDWAPSLPLLGRLKKKVATSTTKKEDEGASPISSKVPFVDPTRQVHSLRLAPNFPLVACCDALGRVLVLDAANFLVSRVFKGYRDAQTAWLWCEGTLLLAILAPKRLRLEVWDYFRGRKAKHFDCSPRDRLARPPCTIVASLESQAVAGGQGEAVRASFTDEGDLLLTGIGGAARVL